jgi:uncharacterized membrane protein YeiB
VPSRTKDFDPPVPPPGLTGGTRHASAPPGPAPSGAAQRHDLEVAGSVGVALVVIAVGLVVTERLPRATSPLVAVGAMALTVYTGHVVAPAVLDRDFDGAATWLGSSAAMVVLSSGWRPALGQGPLERLLSSSSRRAAALAVRRPGPRPSS